MDVSDMSKDKAQLKEGLKKCHRLFRAEPGKGYFKHHSVNMMGNRFQPALDNFRLEAFDVYL